MFFGMGAKLIGRPLKNCALRDFFNIIYYNEGVKLRSYKYTKTKRICKQILQFFGVSQNYSISPPIPKKMGKMK